MVGLVKIYRGWQQVLSTTRFICSILKSIGNYLLYHLQCPIGYGELKVRKDEKHE